MKTLIVAAIFVLTFANSIAIGYYNQSNNEHHLQMLEVEKAKMDVIIRLAEEVGKLKKMKRVPVF